MITDYDINDYREKTELTAQKLFTLLYSSLRGYQDIMIIEANKRGLEEIITASATIFGLQSMQQFTQGVLEQLSAMLHLDRNAVYCQSAGLAATHNGESLDIVAGTGEFQNLVGRNAETALDPQILWNFRTRSIKAIAPSAKIITSAISKAATMPRTFCTSAIPHGSANSTSA